MLACCKSLDEPYQTSSRNWQGWRAYAKLERGGPVAQRLEQQTHNLLVVGSSPTGPTSKIRQSASLTETSGCDLWNFFGEERNDDFATCV
jgi:hypothetical protein